MAGVTINKQPAKGAMAWGIQGSWSPECAKEGCFAQQAHEGHGDWDALGL